ncbi:hypothetical protein BDQ12DRAFT_693163 [Crucibulum laeve]|uniref:Uncharacterized protein n=1 Tax=Crucibulum laeve TaxID=68775 RepID=A0A5C3LFW8_9AGAR|nr:hypothetical protein BDQ12DRAFT_693163 [Crucibulum laeve]
MLPLFKLFGALSVLLISCASHSISLAAPLRPGSTNGVQNFDDNRLQVSHPSHFATFWTL